MSNPISIAFNLIILIVLQSLVFNYLNIFDTINPSLYLYFIITYPFKNKSTYFLLLSFILGFSIDLLSQSAGAFSLSLVVCAFIRPTLLKAIYGKNIEIQNINSQTIKLTKSLFFVSIIILINQFVFFSFEYLDSTFYLLILKNTFLNSIFSFILIYITIILFNSNKN